MRRRIALNTNNEIRMMTCDQGSTYTGQGRTAFRAWAEKIGAVRRFGKSVRFDRVVIDKALDEMASAD